MIDNRLPAFYDGALPSKAKTIGRVLLRYAVLRCRKGLRVCRHPPAMSTTMQYHNREKTMPTRRHFLQWAGIGAAASLAAGSGLAQGAAAADQPAAQPHAGQALKLGLASYTFRQFSLDQTLAMTKRVGLKYICLKDNHLPMNSTPEQLAEAAAKAKAAGLDLYGCGVVYMNKPAEVDRAFEYAKGAGMKVIVGVPTHELLALVNERVQQYDIRVAIHNHGPVDKLYRTPDVAYEKVKNLDRRIGLCLDIGHAASLRHRSEPGGRAVRRPAVRHPHQGRFGDDRRGPDRRGRPRRDRSAQVPSHAGEDPLRGRYVLRVRKGRQGPVAGPGRVGRLCQGRAGGDLNEWEFGLCRRRQS